MPVPTPEANSGTALRRLALGVGGRVRRCRRCRRVIGELLFWRSLRRVRNARRPGVVPWPSLCRERGLGAAGFPHGPAGLRHGPAGLLVRSTRPVRVSRDPMWATRSTSRSWALSCCASSGATTGLLVPGGAPALGEPAEGALDVWSPLGLAAAGLAEVDAVVDGGAVVGRSAGAMVTRCSGSGDSAASSAGSGIAATCGASVETCPYGETPGASPAPAASGSRVNIMDTGGT